MCMYAQPEVGGLCRALVLHVLPAYLFLVSFESNCTNDVDLRRVLAALWDCLVVSRELWPLLMCMYAQTEVGWLCRALGCKVLAPYLFLVSFTYYCKQDMEPRSVIVTVWYILAVF